MTSVLPDSSVRPTIVSDLPTIGRIHAETLRASTAAALGHELAPEVAALIDENELERGWSRSLTAPPSNRHRMLTALEGAQIVGFAALAPADQPLGEQPVEDEGAVGVVEIIALEVPEELGRRGHGSRLVAAVADFAREDRATELQVWIPVGDEARTRFYNTAGFAPRGIRRVYEVGPEGGAEELTEQCWYSLL